MRHIWTVLFLLPFPTLPAQESPALRAAVESYVQRHGAQHIPSYQHAFADLNGDGIKDAIVLLTGTNWCGTDGCTMLVMRGAKKVYSLVSESMIPEQRIRVSTLSVNGWRTLIVGSRGKNAVALPFDGQRYPGNTALQTRADPAVLSGARTLLK